MHVDEFTDGNRQADIEDLPSKEVEVRAIGDAVDRKGSYVSRNTAETKQGVEYEEKRELTVDERENEDPTRH